VLNRNGFDAELINGDLAQKERERVMARVKKGELAFMVATDIAARGIDISDLSHVINYSLPEDPSVYLHRVGRTGRIGKKGTALNLTSGRELATLTALEKKYNVIFERKPMPNAEEAAKMWTDRHVIELKEAAKGSIYEGFLALAGDLKVRNDADELIAFMLRYFFTHRRMEKAQSLDPNAAPGTEAPAPAPMSGHSRGDRPKEDRPPRREGREGGREGGRGRGEGRSREDRPPRREPRASDDKTVPTGVAAVAHVEGSTAAAPASAPRPPRPPSGAPKKRLTDREMFELMQAGKPLPPIDDPTTESASASESSSDRPPRRERSERGERPGRGERGADRPGRGERREPREERAEVAPGNLRLWVNLGKADGVDEAGLGTALSALGAPSGKVAKLELRGTYSYVHVPEGDAPAFESLAGKKHAEKELKIERARR
jgi:ATP-dependent RNA helicase DeaD